MELICDTLQPHTAAPSASDASPQQSTARSEASSASSDLLERGLGQHQRLLDEQQALLKTLQDKPLTTRKAADELAQKTARALGIEPRKIKTHCHRCKGITPDDEKDTDGSWT